MCTGNICRSPIAEAILQQDLANRGVSARVSSAGLMYDGRPAAEEVVELMDARGIDMRGHESRKLNPQLLERVDLVLGMAREHVREAALLEPAKFSRTFTLKELVRRGHAVGPRPTNEPVESWLLRVAEGRRPSDILGASEVDDITDPIGRRFAVFKQVSAEIEVLSAELVDLMWHAVPPA